MRTRPCTILPLIWTGFVHIHLAHALNLSEPSTFDVSNSGTICADDCFSQSENHTANGLPISRSSSSPSGNDSLMEFLAAAGGKVKGIATAKPITSSGIPEPPSLRGIIECYDPPMQRERGYPINISDCEEAAMQIIGNRNKYDFYVFSRRKIKDQFYYSMPARYTHGNCVVLLDMEHPKDIERVRIAYVESSAWVLAHRCSGEEVPQQKYGGSMTVGVGANDLIRVSVYGLYTPAPSGLPVLSLSHNRSSIDHE